MLPGWARERDEAPESERPEASFTPMLTHIAWLVLVSFVVALATSAIKWRDPRLIAAETVRFFTTVFACIVIFGVVAAVLDRLFVG